VSYIDRYGASVAAVLTMRDTEAAQRARLAAPTLPASQPGEEITITQENPT
jgi:hypothetical protein